MSIAKVFVSEMLVFTLFLFVIVSYLHDVESFRTHLKSISTTSTALSRATIYQNRNLQIRMIEDDSTDQPAYTTKQILKEETEVYVYLTPTYVLVYSKIHSGAFS